MRYLLLSDVHANAAALEAVLDDARWDEVIFLGDAVNYGPRPDDVVDRLAELSGLFLAGNHDRKILDTDPERRPEDQPAAWARWTRRQLSDDHLAFLERLSGSEPLEQGDRTFQLHHGDFELDRPGFDGRLWPDADPSVFAAVADRYPASHLVHGHTHVQFEVEREGTTFANPGSVGQPRLGRPQACYAILEDGTLTYRSTEYDIESTCAAMDELPLDRDYVAAWKEAYRTGELPDQVDIRDFEALQACDGVYR